MWYRRAPRACSSGSRARTGRAGALVLIALLTTALGGCRREATGPAPERFALTVHGSDVIYAAANAAVTQPLQVQARNAATGAAASGVEVAWAVTAGSASVARPMSVTDEYGIAEVALTTRALGVSTVQATTERMTGAAPRMEVRAISAPVVTAVTPSVFAPGDIVTISGSGFSTTAAHNRVLFAGVAARQVSGTAAELRVVVPPCLPSRAVPVVVALGDVVSASLPATSTASSASVLTLAPGRAQRLSAGDLACIRLPGDAGAQYLMVLHHAAEELTPPVELALRALSPQAPIVSAVAMAPAPASFAEQWESRLRRSERGFPAGTAALVTPSAMRIPAVGERREFSVLNEDDGFVKVNAVARVVTEHAVIYVDEESPDAFTLNELTEFSGLFGEPILPTLTAVFGQPSDIDSNGRILILFTPRINRLTPRRQNSFVAGYFYGCDLVSRSRCSGTNQGEVFYSMVPDPEGEWGDRRSLETVMANVPPVLAHELQHMINFARRGFNSDVLWLSEALAHTAEELVGEVYRQRGNEALATTFQLPNHARARRYLASPAAISLIGEELPGTLELRGAGWLFLKYVRGHHGGNTLLRSLTEGGQSGTANVTAAAGRSWRDLVADFGLALWADDAPGLTAPVDARHQFADFSPRTVLSGTAGYALQPVTVGWSDFIAGAHVAPAAQHYVLVNAPATGSITLNFMLTGAGGEQAPESAVLTVLRVR